MGKFHSFDLGPERIHGFNHLLSDLLSLFFLFSFFFFLFPIMPFNSHQSTNSKLQIGLTQCLPETCHWSGTVLHIYLLNSLLSIFINLLYKRNRVNSPEAWIINETFRYEDSMRKTATINICIAPLKKISDNDKCRINTYKANHFNTSWMECHHRILCSLP